MSTDRIYLSKLKAFQHEIVSYLFPGIRIWLSDNLTSKRQLQSETISLEPSAEFTSSPAQADLVIVDIDDFTPEKVYQQIELGLVEPSTMFLLFGFQTTPTTIDRIELLLLKTDRDGCSDFNIKSFKIVANDEPCSACILKFFTSPFLATKSKSSASLTSYLWLAPQVTSQHSRIAEVILCETKSKWATNRTRNNWLHLLENTENPSFYGLRVSLSTELAFHASADNPELDAQIALAREWISARQVDTLFQERLDCTIKLNLGKLLEYNYLNTDETIEHYEQLSSLVYHNDLEQPGITLAKSVALFRKALLENRTNQSKQALESCTKALEKTSHLVLHWKSTNTVDLSQLRKLHNLQFQIAALKTSIEQREQLPPYHCWNYICESDFFNGLDLSSYYPKEIGLLNHKIEDSLHQLVSIKSQLVQQQDDHTRLQEQLVKELNDKETQLLSLWEFRNSRSGRIANRFRMIFSNESTTPLPLKSRLKKCFPVSLKRKIKRLIGIPVAANPSSPKKVTSHQTDLNSVRKVLQQEFDLVVCVHQLSRTGAPMVTLDFAKWCTTNLDKRVLFITGGDDHPESDLWQDVQSQLQAGLYIPTNEITSNAPLMSLVKKGLTDSNIHWVVGSILCFDLIKAVNPSRNSVSLMIHENLSYLKHMNEFVYQETCETFRGANVICSSNYTKVEAEKAFGADSVNPKLFPQGIPAKELVEERCDIEDLNEQLGVSSDDFLVFGFGTLDGRKGYDLFLKCAAKCQQIATRPIRFFWVGDSHHFSESVFYAEWPYLANSDKPPVERIPASKDFKKWYQLADLFFLSSRIDPLPVVAQLAQVHGVPVMAFNDGGGTADSLTQIGGVYQEKLLVDGFDWEKAAAQIINLANETTIDQLDQICASGQSYASEHYSYEGYAQSLAETMQLAALRK